MIWFLAPFIGLWRWWDGRGPDGWPAIFRRANGKAFPGAEWVQALILLAGVGALVFLVGHKPWNIALSDGLAVLILAHLAGHTPTLYPPGAVIAPTRISGLEKVFWEIASIVPTAELKWWAFGLLRYVVPACIIGCGIYYEGGVSTHVLFLGAAAVAMLAVYRVTTIPSVDAFLTRIAPFYKNAGHIQYAEFFGWMFIGAVLALA